MPKRKKRPSPKKDLKEKAWAESFLKEPEPMKVKSPELGTPVRINKSTVVYLKPGQTIEDIKLKYNIK